MWTAIKGVSITSLMVMFRRTRTTRVRVALAGMDPAFRTTNVEPDVSHLKALIGHS